MRAAGLATLLAAATLFGCASDKLGGDVPGEDTGAVSRLLLGSAHASIPSWRGRITSEETSASRCRKRESP